MNKRGDYLEALNLMVRHVHNPIYKVVCGWDDRGVIMGDCFRRAFYSFEAGDFNFVFIKVAPDVAYRIQEREIQPRMNTNEHESLSRFKWSICFRRPCPYW